MCVCVHQMILSVVGTWMYHPTMYEVVSSNTTPMCNDTLESVCIDVMQWQCLYPLI